MGKDLNVGRLTTGYTHAPVLREVTVDVRSGESVAILGANGAGKTSLLRAISGTLAPWSGTMRFGGQDIAKLAPWSRVRLGIAHVPEGRHIFGAMTVRENLDVAGLISNARTSLRAEVFSMFPRLAERSNQTAGSLSGGEQQMLAIGRALMSSPQLLLVDEMSAGLAPLVAQELVRSLRAVQEQGVGIALVEQNPHLVVDIVDRIYLLEHGRVAAEGPLADLGGEDAIVQHYLGVQTR